MLEGSLVSIFTEACYSRHGHVPYRYRHHPMVIQLHRYETVNRFPDHYAVAPRELVTLIAAMSALAKLRRHASLLNDSDVPVHPQRTGTVVFDTTFPGV